MKIKTSELTGVALDWAVAKCEGYAFNGHWFKPSTDWAQGGPIIERECINTAFDGFPQGWVATLPHKGIKQFGETPLQAAMRCYVSSKLGDEVEVPDELVKP